MDARPAPPHVLAVCGLAFEAALVAGNGVVPVCATGPDAVAACLDALLADRRAPGAAASPAIPHQGAGGNSDDRAPAGGDRAPDGAALPSQLPPQLPSELPPELPPQLSSRSPARSPFRKAAARMRARASGTAHAHGLESVAGDGRGGAYGDGTVRSMVATLPGGADRAPPGVAGILSFGCAGGLDPGLLPGDCVVATAVSTPAGIFPTDPAWTQTLLACLPRARPGVLAGVDAPLVSSAAKATLWQATGACAADMESHAAALAAHRHGLPFAACRVVLDPAWRTLPPCALAALRTDGTTAPWRLLCRLAADPRQLMALCALGDDAWLARRVLRHVRLRLGTVLGLPAPACTMPRL